jgi:hypothetical protein
MSDQLNFNDRDHWHVSLRGRINGQEAIRSYHLHAENQGLARRGALERWAADFDELPFIVRVERYSSWRVWESSPEGLM